MPALQWVIRVAVIGLLLILLVLPTWTVHGAGTVRFVKENGLTSGTCDGTWDNACTLVYALSIAQSGDQIWVEAGTYTPTTSGSDPPRSDFSTD